MRILVVSDTHRDKASLREALLRQPTAEVVIHLGDGADEFEELRFSFPEKMFLQVRGNNDWGRQLPINGKITLEHKHIFYTHGHAYNVKYGLYEFISTARVQKAHIALFGHTHHAMTEYDDGLYIMNPGALCGMDATYGFIDITKAGIVTNILKL